MIACAPISTPAEFRAAFASVVGLEDLQALARVLLKRALEGNLTAAKMVLTYVMGKPNAKPEAPAPTPAPGPAEPAADVSSDLQRKEAVPPIRLPHARPTSAADDFARQQMPKSPGDVSEPRLVSTGNPVFSGEASEQPNSFLSSRHSGARGPG